MNNGHRAHTMKWALGAGLTGAGMALLLAPRSGADTRKLIRGRAEDLGDGAREVYGKVKKNAGAYRQVMKQVPRKTIGRLVGA